MLEPVVLKDVFGLKPDDFYLHQHTILFRECLELHSQGVAPTLTAVTQRLRTLDQLAVVGGVSYISSLIDTLPDVANCSWYAAQIQRMRHRRDLTRLGLAITNGHFANADEVRRAAEQMSSSEVTDLALLKWDDISKDTTQLAPFIMEPWLREAELVMIFAKRGIGKTTFAMTLAVRLACGANLFDWKVPKKRRVLYVDGEMSKPQSLNKLRACMAQVEIDMRCSANGRWGLRPDLIVHNYNHYALKIGKHPGYLDNEAAMDDFIRKIPTDIDVLVLDNRSCLFGGEENDSAAQDAMLQFLNKLKFLGIAVIMIHHSGKGSEDTFRGSSRMDDTMDTVIALRETKNTEAKAVELAWMKHRNFDPVAEDHKALQAEYVCDADKKPITIKWRAWGNYKVLRVKLAHKELKECGENPSYRKVSEMSGVPYSTCYRIMKKLGL